MAKIKELKFLNKYFFCILIYRIILDASYFLIISHVFEYMGFSLKISFTRFTISYVLMLLCILFTTADEKNITDLFLNIQLIIILLPMLSLYGLSNQNSHYMILLCFCHILQSVIFKIPDLKSNARIMGSSTKYILFLSLYIIIIFGILYSIKLNGLPSLRAFNFNSIYEIRENIVLSFPLNYIMPWLAKAILPFLFIYFWDQKKYLFSFTSIILQIIMYMIFAQKAFLFVFIPVFGVYFFSKKRFLYKGMYVGIIVLIVLVNLLYKLNNNIIMPVGLVLQRILFFPALLKFKYYDFFSTHAKVHFADGVIGKLLHMTSPYEKHIPSVIGEYIGSPDMWANAGYWADAYANYGMVAVIILSIVITLIVKLIQVTTKDMNQSVVFACCALTFYSLNDGALLTNLLTGGFLVMITLLIIINISNRKPISRSQFFDEKSDSVK